MLWLHRGPRQGYAGAVECDNILGQVEEGRDRERLQTQSYRALVMVRLVPTKALKDAEDAAAMRSSTTRPVADVVQESIN